MKPNKLDSINAELINIIVFLLGIISIIIGVFLPEKLKDIEVILISIGSSLIASTVIVFLTSRYLVRKSHLQYLLEKWGLLAIYETRSQMNRAADISLKELRYELDMISFGLKSYRHAVGDIIEEKVKKGLKIRILTINPDSKFVVQREHDEGEVVGQIRKTIFDLIEWIEHLKEISPDPNHIQIKFYDNLPLESYNRQDDYIYTGPYLYNRPSQQTISYEYKKPSMGFNYWNNYFIGLWNDGNLSFDNYDQTNPLP